MKTSGTFFIFASSLVLLALPSSGRVDAQDKKDAPKAKEKEELIDYEALLNDKLGKGVTPEKNAVVLLWKAFGPAPEGGNGMPPAFFKRLGMEEPPKSGDYFISLNSYMKENLKLAPEAMKGVWDQYELARKHPWTEKDYPEIAGWLKINEKPLAIVIEACNRPDYYNPLVSRTADKSTSSIIGALLPAVQKCRELAGALTIRSMLNASADKTDAAWRDLMACHRLGRHVARGGTLIEGLVGIAIDQIAMATDLAFLENPGLSSAKILTCLKDLQTMPPMPPVVDKIDITERMTFLQVIQMMRTNGCNSLNFTGDAPKKLTEEEQKALATIDWDFAVKNATQWYDRIVAAMRLKDRPSREKELDKLGKELEELAKKTKKSGPLSNLLLDPANQGQNIAKAISDTLIGLLIPAFQKVVAAQDRVTQNERNLHLAFALAAYKSDQGKYPTQLADLSPKYLATVPDDLFSGKPLVYKPSEKGYLLYSVGPNGKDDDGHDAVDNPPGDDLRVRMPLPPLKK